MRDAHGGGRGGVYSTADDRNRRSAKRNLRVAKYRCTCTYRYLIL
eukprot:SAG31_NODE_34691_length_330_cov_1.077922_1_plen_44_part_10